MELFTYDTVKCNHRKTTMHIFLWQKNHRKYPDKIWTIRSLNVIKLPAGMIEKMIDAGQFQQAIHITAWLLAQRRE